MFSFHQVKREPDVDLAMMQGDEGSSVGDGYAYVHSCFNLVLMLILLLLLLLLLFLGIFGECSGTGLGVKFCQPWATSLRHTFLGE